MGDKDSEQNALVHILVNPSAEAKELPFSLLKDITEFFSNEREIGGGTFGVVYKGELRNGMKVAVKRLKHFGWILDDKKFYAEFYAEVDCLKKLKNKNIVRLLGYCVHIEKAELMVEGKKVPVETNRERLLCFEFIPHGTVQKAGASHGAEWPKRYQIIKGICHGLEYIHNAKYLHLDLKPDNILLGENMEPKITDFGVSRFFGDQSTHDTMRNSGTRGYMAPEYINKGTVSEKTDIYSLGVVIFELVTGSKGPDVHESTHKQKDLFLEKALLDWRRSLCNSHRGRSLELACQQVETCIKIALNCTDLNRNLRRPIKEIAHILDLASDPYSMDPHTTEAVHMKHFGTVEDTDVHPNEPWTSTDQSEMRTSHMKFENRCCDDKYSRRDITEDDDIPIKRQRRKLHPFLSGQVYKPKKIAINGDSTKDLVESYRTTAYDNLEVVQQHEDENACGEHELIYGDKNSRDLYGSCFLPSPKLLTLFPEESSHQEEVLESGPPQASLKKLDLCIEEDSWVQYMQDLYCHGTM